MSDKKRSDEDDREAFAKGGRAKFAQRYDPSIKGSAAQKSGERPILPGYKRGDTGKIVPAQGYPKWAADNTSTVPNDPSNQINRAKGEPQKEAPAVKFSHTSQGPVRTVVDGNETSYSAENDVALNALHKEVPSLGNMNRPEKGHYPPCLNPRCKSYGKSHPNCLCYSAGSEEMWFAKGGAVCSGPHKEDCEHFAKGEMVHENETHLNNPSYALDHVAAHNGLLHLLTKFGKSRSENPHKPIEDYVNDSRSGQKTMSGHTSKLLGKERLDISHDKEGREALKAHLNQIEQNPQSLVDVGGGIGDAMPLHAAALGAKAATAVQYLHALKPKRPQISPLHDPLPPDKQSEGIYNRQLDIANNPSLILQRAKEGSLQPSDMATLNTIYPELSQSIKTKLYAQVIDAKEKGQAIPYKLRIALSTLLGEPLDFTATPMAMMTIMRANGSNQAPSQGPSPKEPKKATQVELNQIDKTNDLLETPTQARLADKKQ